MLMKAKLTYPPEEQTPSKFPKLKNTTCPTITCRYCKLLHKEKMITSSFLNSKLTTRVNCRISCLTNNVIYCITCLKCSAQYVGETKRQLKKCMYEHLRSIDCFHKVQPTPVSEHFKLECKRPACLKFQILETIRGDPTSVETTKHRRMREKWWILNLRSLDPAGINKFT